jgi:UDP-N-acetylmuramate--alanine ligase
MQCIRRLENYTREEGSGYFQPHLFSRTSDFADDFAKSLSNFDEILLMDIYPARGASYGRITSDWLLSKIDNKNKKLVTKENIIESILKVLPR